MIAPTLLTTTETTRLMTVITEAAATDHYETTLPMSAAILEVDTGLLLEAFHLDVGSIPGEVTHVASHQHAQGVAPAVCPQDTLGGAILEVCPHLQGEVQEGTSIAVPPLYQVRA